MSSYAHPKESAAGQIAWTRDLARDLFPGIALPFAWSVLHAPLEAALRRSWLDLGAPDTFHGKVWRRAPNGTVWLDPRPHVAAAEALCGAAWFGPTRPALRAGFFGRLQAGNVVRRAEARLAGVPAQAQKVRAGLARWLHWVRGLRWMQADLLQVMEELEPQAQAALEVYFLARAGLPAAHARVLDLLPDDAPPLARLGSYAGLAGAPSLESAFALGDLARRASPDDPDWLPLGHLGPNALRPDAARWDVARGRNMLRPYPNRRDLAHAQAVGREAASAVMASAGAKAGQLEGALAAARALLVAADVAWDAVVHVMAAAQLWAGAAAREAEGHGLIADRSEVLYLELEELKQVATGEWHGGRGDEVRAEVAARRYAAETAGVTGREIAPGRGERKAGIAVSPGRGAGPVYRWQEGTLPPSGAVWAGESADAGYAPFWPDAAAVIAAADDPWSPGMIAARLLALPAVAGTPLAVGAPDGVPLRVEGDTGDVAV